MPNIAQFNSNLFNSWARLWWAGQITDDLIFNGLWLQNQFIITSKIDFWNMPKTNLLTYTNPKSDWWGVLDRFFKDRTITIEGVILWIDADDLETRIDAIKKVLSVKTWYLQMKIKGTYRRILATLTNQDIFDRNHSDITRAPFKLTFKAMQPFRSEKEWVAKTFYWITTDINEDITNDGSEYSEPIINILIRDASNVSQLVNTIWNNSLTINTTLNQWDIFEINCIDKVVSLNWNSIDFSWRFPTFESWVNIYSMDSNWIFEYDIAILFPKNYL